MNSIELDVTTKIPETRNPNTASISREWYSSNRISNDQHTFENYSSHAKKTGRCHGNRKLYHFRRKWRARGLDEEGIQALVESRQPQQCSSDPRNDSHRNEQENTGGEKRKGNLSTSPSIASSMKSLTQLSIS